MSWALTPGAPWEGCLIPLEALWGIIDPQAHVARIDPLIKLQTPNLKKKKNLHWRSWLQPHTWAWLFLTEIICLSWCHSKKKNINLILTKASYFLSFHEDLEKIKKSRCYFITWTYLNLQLCLILLSFMQFSSFLSFNIWTCSCAEASLSLFNSCFWDCLPPYFTVVAEKEGPAGSILQKEINVFSPQQACPGSQPVDSCWWTPACLSSSSSASFISQPAETQWNAGRTVDGVCVCGGGLGPNMTAKGSKVTL